jgi:exodeoxyribonuclease VII small subunit
MNTYKKVEELSFEEGLNELQEIVRGIESGKDDLEKVISSYERGNALKAHCENKLKEAKLRIEKIVENSDGSISTEEGL